PQITIEPIITAITESPGIPRAIVVVKAPPNVAPEAASADATPSTEPLPNFSGSLDTRRAWSHPTMPAISPPAAGTIPTKVPTAAPMPNGFADCLYSDLFGHQRPNPEMGVILLSWWVMIWSSSSETPKSPMMTAMKGIPELRSLIPNTNRSSPVIGSRPTVAIASPSNPASSPLRTDFE